MILTLFARTVGRKIARVAFDVVFYGYGYVSRFKRPIRLSLAGENKLPHSKRAAIYVHFDPNGVIHEYVLHQLNELKKAGFATTFVSNSPCFSMQSAKNASLLCSRLMWRRNTGYDFGAYKDGIASLGDTAELEQLLLLNDSVYGPFWSLNTILQEADTIASDFWGITDSFQYSHHIQSYFMLFQSRALNAPAFKNFWRRFPYLNDKRWIIRNGEVRLSKLLENANLKGNVLAPYRKVAARSLALIESASAEADSVAGLDHLKADLAQNCPLNPMHAFWQVLIEDFHCPFIKRELIKLNPMKLPNVDHWPEVINNVSDYDISLVRKHLETSHSAGSGSDKDIYKMQEYDRINEDK